MELETIKGIVERKIYYNEHNHYGVFLIELDGSPLTIVGKLFNLQVDSTYKFQGRYVENPRYGMQFEVLAFEQVIPSEKEYVIRYLSGPSFPGIGVKSAEAIVEKYGEDFIEKLRSQPDMELSIKGLGKDKLENLREKIVSEDPMDEIISFLNAFGITGKTMLSIINYYKEDTKYLLEEDPYRMIEDISGIGFKTCDKIGLELGFQPDDIRRLTGLMNDTYRKVCFGSGHSYIYKKDLYDQMPPFEISKLDEAYFNLIKSRILIEDEERLYHHTQFDAEVFIAESLKDTRDFDLSLDDFNDQIEAIEADLGLTFDEVQKEAMEKFLFEDVMILTGGPGTGKSTLLSGLVMLLQRNYPEYHITLCAPTGRAAKRLEDLTNVTASTIHSVLKWNPDSNEFGFNELNPLETDILIVDEFSMVDTWLFHKLLLASNQVKKILIVGDKDQLPSVGPGLVLQDLLESKKFEIVELEYNYRQVEGSEVIDLALKVNRNEFNVDGYHRDVKFFDVNQYPKIELILAIVREALDKGYSIFDIQILAPMYRGTLGIDNLNYFLQKAFNPDDGYKRSIKFGSKIFREGDKILQLKNQPDDFVYNGDIGILEEIWDDQVIVNFDGNFVEYERSDLMNITHAYCMSVHKAQGSEYPIVILLAVLNYGQMLSKRLYYTAISRSSKSLVLVGDMDAFEKAALNDYETKRNTYLKNRLEE